MNSNFTEAVMPTSTAVEPSVKRLCRGDIREDGMIFWGRHKAGSEYWVNEEIYRVKRENNRKSDRKRYSENRPHVLARKTKWRRLNREKVAEKRRASYRKNPEPHRKRTKAWRKEHPEKAAAATKRWRTKNPRYREKRASRDPVFALTNRLRCRLGNMFKERGFARSRKTEDILGCSFEGFKSHIESLFLPGMSWDNRHLWHIDHIVPCKAGKTKEQIEALFHYTNLRPMWGSDNCSKYAKLPEEYELPDSLHPKVKEIYLTAKAASAR